MAVVEAEGPLDEEMVRQHCLAELARDKSASGFVAVGALPRNAMGEVVRGELAGLI